MPKNKQRIKNMKKRLSFIAAAICLYAPALQAFSLNHEFNVFLGPFNASRTEFEYSLGDKDYQVNANVKTFGLFDSLYPFHAQYATTGKIKNNQMETTSYKYESKSRFTKRSKELVYDNNGNPVYRLSSKNGKEKKVDIDQKLNSGDTTDLQTVFAKLAKQFNEVRFCNSRFEVFDGKRRFDVIFADEGEEELKSNELQPWSVKAKKCSMYIDKLGSNGDDLLWQLTSDKPIYFWIAEEPSGKRPFIVKVYVENTPLGELNLYTTKISVKENN